MDRMDKEKFIEREDERAKRLFEFVRQELASMYVGSRFQFTIDIFTYLEPEVRQLLKENRIKAPE